MCLILCKNGSTTITCQIQALNGARSALFTTLHAHKESVRVLNFTVHPVHLIVWECVLDVIKRYWEFAVIVLYYEHLLLDKCIIIIKEIFCRLWIKLSCGWSYTSEFCIRWDPLQIGGGVGQEMGSGVGGYILFCSLSKRSECSHLEQ